MKKILVILAAVVLAMPMVAQEAQANAAMLHMDGNTYYYGDQKLSNSELLNFYAQQNCQEAYDQFRKARQVTTAGWAFLGIGGALDVGAIVCAALYIRDRQNGNVPATGNPMDADTYAAMIGLTLSATAFELACIPMLVVGYHKQHSSVDTYNQSCAKASAAKPYWAIQASENGLGLAFKF